ncbi:hypothetical protein OFC04_24780, partial [Escherichia coli]|nr:hypothetical protein [Escherichia coli]
MAVLLATQNQEKARLAEWSNASLDLWVEIPGEPLSKDRLWGQTTSPEKMLSEDLGCVPDRAYLFVLFEHFLALQTVCCKDIISSL